MKKFLTLILVLMLALATFASCDMLGNLGNIIGGNTGEGGGNTGDNGQESKPDEDLQAAYDYIKLTYKTLDKTTANFEVMKNAPIGEKIFAITWTTDNAAITITESEDGNFYVVNVPELGEAAITYALKFSIENDKGEKKEGSFNLTVPAFSVNTFDEYVAAEDGKLLIVEGIVTGVISKSVNSTKENSLFIQDLNGNGGYYIYNLAEDPKDTISVGMTVRVSGNKKNYNGTFELVSPVVTVLDETIKPVTPVDYTDVLANAASLSAPELTNKNGMLVKINGVTLLEYNESNGYHYFKLGEHKTYLRVSSSSNCITKDEGKTLTKSFQDNFYNAADVVGIIAVYNGDFYLMPVSAAPFTNFVQQEKPADVKVDIALSTTTIPGFIQTAGDTTLPANSSAFSDVAIAWELVPADGVDCVTLNGNTLTATIPAAAQTVTLKATFTAGDISKSKEYTVTVKGIDTITIKQADDMVADFVKNQYTEEKFYVIGKIEQISNDIYGNMFIVAIIDGAEYGIDIYGMYDLDNNKYSEFTGYKPQVGDTVKVLTVVGKYNNAQLKNAVLVEYNHNYDAGVVTPPTCVSDGYTTYTCACGHSYTDNVVAKGDHYYGEGVTDTTDKVCTGCGIKNHTHTTIATNTVVAPTCTAEGYTVYACSDEACAFTENKDVTAATGVHTDANGDFVCDFEDCDAVVAPAADTVLTVEQAIALASKFAHNTYTQNKYYVTGTVNDIYNAQYGNMHLLDGNFDLTLYGTYSEDGSIKFGAFVNKPAVGDVITVYGILGTYNGTAQMKNGWIKHSYNEGVVTAPDCTHQGYTTHTCKYCGYSYQDNIVDAGDCSYDENGVCTGCGIKNHTHTTVATDIVVAPTCTAEGYTVYACSDEACAFTENKDATAAIGHVDADGDFKCDFEDCDVAVAPAANTVLTVEQAIALGLALGGQYTTDKYYVTGTVDDIYNAQYGNMHLLDGDADLVLYGAFNFDGTVRFDALANKPVEGDYITVYGIIGSYNGTAQMKNGWIQHSYNEGVVTAPDCKNQGYTTYTCKFCGHSYNDNFVDAGECTYGDNGVCAGCGIKNHDHTTVATEIVVAPTCIAEGYTVYACSDEACAFTENKDVTAATGVHTDANGDFVCDTDDCDAVVAPAADTVLTVEQAIAFAKTFAHNTYSTGKYYVTGTVDDIYNTQYGNMHLLDGEFDLIVYGTYSADGETRFDALTTKPVVGDVITVYGILGTFNGKAQLKNGWIQHSNTEEVTAPTCTEGGYTTYTCKFCGATSTGAETDALGHNFVNNVCDREGCGALDHVHSYTEEVTAPTCYSDGYTTYTCDCSDSYVGNVIPATGAHVDANADYKCDTEGCTKLVLPADGSTLTITEAIKIGKLTASNQYTTEKYYVTGVITSVYNTQYGNMYITDGIDTITVYGLYKDGARYDAMTVKPVAFDTITVYGGLGNYNGSAQFKNAELTSHVAHVECTEFTEATCQTKAACVVCGKQVGELAACNYVDGTCTVCGAAVGETIVTNTVTLAYTTTTTTNMTGNNDAAKLGIDANIFSVIGNKGGTNNNCGLNKAGQIRLYGSSATGNGSYFTVTSAEGYTIKSIKINFFNTTNNKNCQLTVGEASQIFDGSSKTWEVDINSNSFKLQNVIKGATTQIYISSIEITYVVPNA